ncbi:hypothetical protein MUP77_08220 [Candidatus Bathyarchaeota archaeon]|nr:hypothetical protein [Candidatus Bathyarchaeota archaeon]
MLEAKSLNRDFKDTGIPTSEIGGVKIPRLILGTLPFVGESYQGPEKNRTYIQRFSNIETTTELLMKAITSCGLTAVGIMPPEISELSSLFFQALKTVSEETGVEPGLVACFTIPLKIGSKPVDEYRRWITYYNIEAARDKDVAEKYFKDPILLCREGWNEKFPLALTNLHSYSAKEIRKLSFDRAKLEEILRPFKEYKVLLIEPGSETDFLAMTGRIDILQEILDYARDSLGCPAVLGIHHAGSTIPILENSNVDVGGYLTPVNSLGALMFPSKEEALKAIKNSKRPLVAIKPLAGGRIPPEKAFRFVYGEAHADACMVGVASEEELEIDVQEAIHVLLG